MIELDEDALICDLAETYGIMDYKELPPGTVAALSIGLRDDSRIKMKLSGRNITLDQQLMAAMVDSLRFIQWTKTDHGRKKRYDGKSVYDALMNPKEKDTYQAFDSPEDFDEYMKTFERRI